MKNSIFKIKDCSYTLTGEIRIPKKGEYYLVLEDYGHKEKSGSEKITCEVLKCEHDLNSISYPILKIIDLEPRLVDKGVSIVSSLEELRILVRLTYSNPITKEKTFYGAILDLGNQNELPKVEKRESWPVIKINSAFKYFECHGKKYRFTGEIRQPRKDEIFLLTDSIGIFTVRSYGDGETRRVPIVLEVENNEQK